MSKKDKMPLLPKLRFPDFQENAKWDKKTLGELGELISGLTYSPDDIRKEGLLVLRSSNIKNGIISLEDNVFVRPDIKGANITMPNDILICVRNGSKALIGKNALIPKNMPLCTHGAFMTIFRTKNYKFVYQLFQTTEYEKQVNRDLGATINSINGTQLKKYVFFVPKDTKEQQKIADCLSSLDDLITAEDKKFEGLKAHKKGLIQKLFPAEGETVPEWRFPEFRGKKEWYEIKLIDTTDKKKEWSFVGGPFGSNLKSSDYTNAGVRIIQLQNIGDAEFVDTYKIFTSEKKADELISSNIYPGEIIMSKMGDPVGRACLVPNNHSRYVMCSDGIRLVVDENLYCKYFIYSLINSTQFRAAIEKNSTGSTRKRIGLDVLKNLSMVVPDKPEQQKIADCLSSLDSFINAQAQKIESLRAHKKSLLQGLFPSIEEVGG